MSRSTILNEIQQLDPKSDHQRIVYLSSCFDFPFDTTRALELALFRTFCVPSISALLDRTGEFQHRAQKRYDDTDILVSEMMEWGYDSERGMRAIRRMNQLHGRFEIANDDFLYVLSTFAYEPIRWNTRFGWRPMCERERLAYFYFWREVGHRMNIRDIPETYAAFDRFNQEYERTHFRLAESNRRIGNATCDMFVSWFPRPAAPAVRAVILALLDDSLIEAFGFARPSSVVRRVMLATMSVHAWGLRHFPGRRKPRLRTAMQRTGYPDGYVIEQIGPPETTVPSSVPKK